jgi:hypothetical protein
MSVERTIRQAIAILDHNAEQAELCGEVEIADDLRGVRAALAGLAVVHFGYDGSILSERQVVR